MSKLQPIVEGRKDVSCFQAGLVNASLEMLCTLFIHNQLYAKDIESYLVPQEDRATDGAWVLEQSSGALLGDLEYPCCYAQDDKAST